MVIYLSYRFPQNSLLFSPWLKSFFEFENNLFSQKLSQRRKRKSLRHFGGRFESEITWFIWHVNYWNVLHRANSIIHCYQYNKKCLLWERQLLQTIHMLYSKMSTKRQPNTPSYNKSHDVLIIAIIGYLISV